MVIFLLLGSGDAFTWKWKDDPQGVLHSPKVAVGLFSSLAFILGALTSMVCGYLGMMVGTYGNVRTAVEARRGMAPAFSAAYRSGSVMGFLLSALALLMLFAAVHLYRLYFKDDWASLFAAVAGYGLGGSTVALFGRVGGGVYTKAADVGADLAGKIGQGIPEDDPRNAGVIADLVGDCVGAFPCYGYMYALNACAIQAISLAWARTYLAAMPKAAFLHWCSRRSHPLAQTISGRH